MCSKARICGCFVFLLFLLLPLIRCAQRLSDIGNVHSYSIPAYFWSLRPAPFDDDDDDDNHIWSTVTTSFSLPCSSMNTLSKSLTHCLPLWDNLTLTILATPTFPTSLTTPTTLTSDHSLTTPWPNRVMSGHFPKSCNAFNVTNSIHFKTQIFNQYTIVNIHFQ